MNEPVGFIGLGVMGRGMAHNLIRHGLDLTVWNRTPSRTKPLEKAGARVAASIRELAAHCPIVILCVSDTPDAAAVIEEAIPSARPGTLFIDTSTISPSVTRTLAGKLADRNMHMLDAPISGGSEGAANGTLSIMIGGESDQVARAMPCFEAMGTTITHVGGHGAGQTVKLVNQILVVVNMLAVSEALTFAEAGELDLEKTLEAVTGGAAGSWMLANRGPQCTQRDWRPGFTIDLQLKDLRLVLDAADELGVPLIGAGACFHLYRSLQRNGLGSEGNHALVKALERLSGIEVGKQAGMEPGATS
ncbi:MAG: NAD(P)-dependent oxidoreductase [Bacteroidetes bacterium SB0662_bin_6]|nr:NAD(P)-dependent oxidoreductase [Bacteroidetes bacterium SB0668_bin_1]MYE03375.1 NAD(P)-dependent oxidoreductase [Bacteroidetes bacterium SB0662_bin_6]